MKKAWKITLGTYLLLVSTLSFSIEPNEIRILVKYQDPKLSLQNIKNINTEITNIKATKVEPIAGNTYLLTFKSTKNINKLNLEKDIVKKLQNSPKIKYAIKDRQGHVPEEPMPTNPLQSINLDHKMQWDQFARPGGIMLESAPGAYDGAWLYTTGISGSPVYVAVLDTGVTLNENLMNNFLYLNNNDTPWGWNFAQNNNNVIDSGIGSSFHGTHVAGTIAAYGDVKGVGENLQIIPIKIPNEDGMFYESNVINAIYWAVGASVPDAPSNGFPARVINMSFSVDIQQGEELATCDPLLQEAIDYARQAGAVVVIAAGNSNNNNDFKAPAVCKGTIRVASTGPTGLRSYFSNYGSETTLAAPGGDISYGSIGAILSTVNPGGGIDGSGYGYKQGTSMAAPHVSGVAGLMFALTNQAIDSQYVETLLTMTTHEFGESDNENESCVGSKPCGSGIVDAAYAVEASREEFDVFYSAPTVKKTYTALSNKYIGDNKAWILIKHPEDNCLKKPYPYVSAAKNGKIYAYSEGKTYYLDTADYGFCKVIGYNGVGCRK